MVPGQPGGRRELPEAPPLGLRPVPRPGAIGPSHTVPAPPPAGCSQPAPPATAPIAFPATGVRQPVRRVQLQYRQLARPRYPGLYVAPPRIGSARPATALPTPPT